VEGGGSRDGVARALACSPSSPRPRCGRSTRAPSRRSAFPAPASWRTQEGAPPPSSRASGRPCAASACSCSAGAATTAATGSWARGISAPRARVSASPWRVRPREVRGEAAQAVAGWRGAVEEVGDDSGPSLFARAFAEADLVVDALLGTGTTGAARGVTAQIIEQLNRAASRDGLPVIALDVPSGLGSDDGAVPGPAVRATLTPTFAGLKRSLLLHPAAEHVGRVVVVPIGVPQAEVDRGVTTFLLEDGDIRQHFPRRPSEAHKGSYGHLLVIAGSVGKTGAAALAGRSALRSGVGLCTVATPASQQPIVAGFSMEAMTEPISETAAQSLAVKAREHLIDLAMPRDAVALGPGISLDPETQALARALVAEVPRPMVVDADALSALAGHLDLLEQVPAPRVLTPHPGEM